MAQDYMSRTKYRRQNCVGTKCPRQNVAGQNVARICFTIVVIRTKWRRIICRGQNIADKIVWGQSVPDKMSPDKISPGHALRSWSLGQNGAGLYVADKISQTKLCGDKVSQTKCRRTKYRQDML